MTRFVSSMSSSWLWAQDQRSASGYLRACPRLRGAGVETDSSSGVQWGVYALKAATEVILGSCVRK